MVVKFNYCGTEMKVTASKQVLNMLSIVFDEASELMTSKGYECSSEIYREISHEIFDQLDNTGYYD